MEIDLPLWLWILFAVFILFFGFILGWVSGITTFVYSAIDHLDTVKSIQIEFNETKMVDAMFDKMGYNKSQYNMSELYGN